MKPLNRDEPGCNFTSSNCVIWQGPDIPCIKLCKGDSVSDVVFKLATELCDVLTTLDISTYDLSCLNITTCAPKNFHEFLQLIIQTICDLQACCAGNPGAPVAQSFNDVVLPVAPIYYYTNEFGDQVTTMTITQYVTAIGNRTNTQQGQINSIQTTVASHTDQIQTLQTEVAAIPTVVEETVIPICTTNPPGVPVTVPIMLQNLENAFCELRGATGMPTSIYQALTRECPGLTNAPTLDGSGRTYGSIPGWVNNMSNLSDSINNMWLFLCDIRAGMLNIRANCCPTGCDGVELRLTATLAGDIVSLFVQGSITPGFVECTSPGTLITITDQSGGSYTTYFNILTALNGTYNISLNATPINLADNLNVLITPCLKDPSGSIVCQSVLEHIIVNIANCPAMVYTPSTDSIGYAGISNPGTAEYTVELWNGAGSVLIASQVQVLVGPAPIAGTFSGLPINTSYKIRLVVGVGTPIVQTFCQFVPISLVYTAIIPVDLGIATSFVLLAGAGINETSGASTFIGDVGSDPTVTITGITPPQVTGVLYTVSNPTVIAAKVSLGNAKAYIAGLSPFVTVPDALGGTVLTPGYYNTTGGTIDITGNVTFDGLGAPGSVWVIDAATTLAIALGATVTLINGALWQNIFFNVGSTVNIADNAVVNGNILAHGDIIVASNVTLNGRLLTEIGLQDITLINASNI